VYAEDSLPVPVPEKLVEGIAVLTHRDQILGERQPLRQAGVVAGLVSVIITALIWHSAGTAWKYRGPACSCPT
jgi:hypothetical protein